MWRGVECMAHWNPCVSIRKPQKQYGSFRFGRKHRLSDKCKCECAFRTCSSLSHRCPRSTCRSCSFCPPWLWSLMGDRKSVSVCISPNSFWFDRGLNKVHIYPYKAGCETFRSTPRPLHPTLTLYDLRTVSLSSQSAPSTLKQHVCNNTDKFSLKETQRFYEVTNSHRDRISP